MRKIRFKGQLYDQSNIYFYIEDDYQEIRQNIIRRDELQEKSGFYEYSPITIEIDVTDCKSVAESTDKVLEKIKQNI